MTHREAQPRGLYSIAATNLAERFGYYAMRSILVLYMIKVLLFSNDHAYAIFAAFTALLYLAPFIGGHAADRWLGTKPSVLLGNILLSTGYFLLALPGTVTLYFALATIIIGNGFFMPNISSTLGKIYRENDSRRESGFAILYSAVNLGAFIPPLICTGIIVHFGWHAAFFMAGIATLISTGFFYFSADAINYFSRKVFFVLVASLIVAIPLIASLIQHPHISNSLLLLSGILLTLLIVKESFNFNSLIRNRLLVCVVLTAFSILFCVLCEQAAMSLTVYTEYNVNRHFDHWLIPTVSFLALNPLFIILCAPLLAKLWLSLGNTRYNPSTPTKFAFGTILAGLGFVIFPLAIHLQSVTGQIHFSWIVLSYLLQSLGELLVYPVGLSMMTELAPRQMTGLMIGFWYFATAVANALAGYAAISTVVVSKTNNPLQTSAAYAHTFGTLGIAAILSGFGLLFFSRLIQNLMVKENKSPFLTH